MDIECNFCTIHAMINKPITFLYGTHIRTCDHDICKYFKGYYTLQYMDTGAVHLSINAQTYALNGHWFWSAWPGPLIAFRPAAGHRTWVHRYLAFRGPGVLQWKQAGLFPILPQRAPPGSDYATRFDNVLSLFYRRDPWAQRRAIHAMEGILLELAEARSREQPPITWIAQVTETLEQWACDGRHDYAGLAQRLNISVSTLRRQFKRATGRAPHDYLLNLRIASARQMLAESSIAIKEIARRLGYRDVFYFSRQFHAIAGASPANYRRSTQG